MRFEMAFNVLHILNSILFGHLSCYCNFPNAKLQFIAHVTFTVADL